MKMRVLGFSWNEKSLPAAVPAVTVFERIEAVSGVEFKDQIGAVTTMGNWWAGVIVKIRDAKSFTKMRKEKGVVVVSTEELKEGEHLAEANFFLAHKSNGHGLYSYHYRSSALLTDFANFCARRFQEVAKERRDLALKEPIALTQKQKKAIRKEFNGKLLIEQIVKPGGFAQRIKTLQRINRLEANLVSFELKNRRFKPLSTYAKRSKIIMSFGLNAPMGVVASAIEDSMDIFSDAKVIGEDIGGLEQVYKMFHDAQVFEEYDYDESMREMELRFDALPDFIKCSPVIAKMHMLASMPSTQKMLGI